MCLPGFLYRKLITTHTQRRKLKLGPSVGNFAYFTTTLPMPIITHNITLMCYPTEVNQSTAIIMHSQLQDWRLLIMAAKRSSFEDGSNFKGQFILELLETNKLFISFHFKLSTQLVFKQTAHLQNQQHFLLQVLAKILMFYECGVISKLF